MTTVTPLAPPAQSAQKVTAQPPPRRRRRGATARTVAYWVGAAVIFVVFCGPILLSALASVTGNGRVSSLLQSWTSAHYATLNDYGYGLAVHGSNSAITAGLTVLMTVVVSTLAGYAFSRFSWPGKNATFLFLLAILMIPFQTVLIPLFVLLQRIGLDNSLVGLALVYATYQLPFAVFMMRNSFDAIPRELDEAAALDGCGPVRSLRMMLPLVVPGIVTVGLFGFLASWNEFLAALIFLGDASKQTLPLVLQNATVGNFGTVDWGALQAGVVVTMLPAVVIFLVLQRYYVSGLTSGAVKA